jgi:hypothetical protein
MKDDLVFGILLGVAVGTHYAAGLVAYTPLIVLFLVIGAAKLIIAKK